MKPLRFVDNALDGKERRKLIRSHVMQGKTAGKVYTSRKGTRPAQKKNDGQVMCLEDDQSRNVHLKKNLLGLRRLLWSDLTLLSFAAELDDKSMRLVHNWFMTIRDALCPLEFCLAIDIPGSIWVQYLTVDRPYFHSTLAISASFIDSYRGHHSPSSTALTHITKAYRLVNERLSGDDALSDHAIASVVSLALFERVCAYNSRGQVHFRGLQRMIHLRGGLSTLTDNRQLLIKLWRLDVGFAIEDGSTVVFHSYLPRSIIFSDFHRNFDPDNICPSAFTRTLQSHLLADIAIDVAHFASLINSAYRERKLGGYDFQEAVLLLCYRLVQFRTVDGSKVPNDPDSLCHLTLITFMTTVFMEYGYNARYKLLSGQLRSSMEETILSRENCGFMLWCIFVGGIALFDAEDDKWMHPLLSRACQRLQLDSWEGIRDVLISFAWVKSIHDKPGKALWVAFTDGHTGGDNAAS